MGTPEFSVPALKALHESDHNILLVVTQPDRPKGRGKKLLQTPVKEYALSCGYEIYQPKSLNNKESFEFLKKFNPDFYVVVAFGQILNKDILSVPKISPVNIHASLLPKYRGSAPIHRSLLNGDSETGITTMFMNEGMDTGDILLTSKIDIEDDYTTETLHDKLSKIGADLIIETLDNFESITPHAQDNSIATHAPMLSKKEGLINWSKSTKEIDFFVRGMTSWPGAYTYHGDKRLKIFSVENLSEKCSEKPGIVINCKDTLQISTGDSSILIKEIQGASGKRMNAADFLRGYKINKGESLK